MAAGFTAPAFTPLDIRMDVSAGGTLEDAVIQSSAMGPAKRALADQPDDIRAAAIESIRRALAPYASDAGVGGCPVRSGWLCRQSRVTKFQIFPNGLTVIVRLRVRTAARSGKPSSPCEISITWPSARGIAMTSAPVNRFVHRVGASEGKMSVVSSHCAPRRALRVRSPARPSSAEPA